MSARGTKAAETATPTATETVVSYKGFDANLVCKPNGAPPFQYAIGGSYDHLGVTEACKAGFHACEYPLDVFRYYPPSGNRFAQVEQSGVISRHNEDSKVASSKITVTAEIGIPGLVKAAIEYTFKRCLPVDPESPASSTGYRGAASSTGYRGAASSTGEYGAASSTGYQGAASSTGDYGAASSTGYQGAASSTGYRGAASSTGDYGAASSTGDYGAASSTGAHSVALACGAGGRAMAAESGAIVLINRNDEGAIRHIRSSKVGENGIVAGRWYTLNDEGEFVEVIP